MANACILAALLAVACTTTVSSALSTTTNEIGTWTDLFQPPYQTGVGNIGGLSCNTDTSCYVCGTTSLLSFSGVPNGTFTHLGVLNPRLPITAIAVSGPADAPGGVVVVGGYERSVGYPVNNMTFATSNTPAGYINSEDARASADGREVLVIIRAQPSVLYSSNGGKDFILKTIDVELANKCTTSRYGHMVDKNTWYVTMGSGPADNCKVFSAQIVKTTDGGNTWTTQFSQASQSSHFFFEAIECLDATHCVAVAGGDSGGYIYRTVDGQTWKLVFTGPSASFLTFVRASAHGHLFAAGNKKTRTSSESYMVTSVDGGATWVEEKPIPNVRGFTGLSFTPGGHGFATAMCDIYGNSTILRYDPAPSQLPH